MTGYPWNTGDELFAADLNAAIAHGLSATQTLISDTAPAGALDNTLWWDSSGTGLYIRYNDGTSSQWVRAENQVGTGGAFLPLAGGTVSGPTTFNANVGVAGEIIPARLNLGAANGNGLACALSPTQGLDHTGSPIWVNYNFTGTNANPNNQNFNSIIVNDYVSYSGNGQSNALYIGQHAGAQATRAGGLWVDAQQSAAPTSPFSFCTALTAASSLAYNCGGTGLTFGNTAGDATTFNTYTSAGPGATFITGIVGYEMDIHAQAGCSLGSKTGLLVVLLADDAVSGAFGNDCAIAFGGPGPATAWDHMLYFGGGSGQIPYKTTATLIGAGEPQTPSTGQALATWGIDLSPILFSGGFVRSIGFSVDGSGNVTGQRFNMSNWSFTPSSTGLTISAPAQRASLTSIAAGGGGWNVGDKATTATGGVYRVTAVSGGVATAVTQLVPDTTTAAPPANPVATSATNTSVYHPNATGLTLNLAWTAANALSLPPLTNAASDAAAATAGVPVGALYRNGNAVQVRLV